MRLFTFSLIGLIFGLAAVDYGYAYDIYGFESENRAAIVKTPTDGGIRLDIADRYKARFERWKAEFLATEFGRERWAEYENNKQFVLTITVTDKKGKGAGTDKYLWDANGALVGATITLGDELNEGYPNPIYYPVMNSLATGDTSYSISGRILAAAKLSHEMGHVNQTAKGNHELTRLQNSLIPIYTSIFLSNGRNTRAKDLVELAHQMGGTPVEIWESREYWSEIDAMLYLTERISNEDYHCFVFNKIRRNIEMYAKDYEPRFGKYQEFAKSPCWN